MLRQHLSLLVPLLTLLFSLQCLLILERTVATQERTITQKYAIGITATNPLSLEAIQSKVVEARALTPLDPREALTRLTKGVEEGAIVELSKQLPYFYSLSLEHFPSVERLGIIEAVLRKNPDIIAVDTFSKRHSENYMLLSFIKFSVITFSIVLGVISLMLLLKQIEIWRYASKEKMEIMDFLGASVWTRNRSLFKLALFDSFFSSFLIGALTFYIASLESTLSILQSMGLGLQIFHLPLDFCILFISGFVASSLCVVFVILSKARA